MDETGAGERVWNSVTRQTVLAVWLRGKLIVTRFYLDAFMHSEALMTIKFLCRFVCNLAGPMLRFRS